LILEAFAEYLHNADPKLAATEVLAEWLWKRLSAPPLTNVDRVLHYGITLCQVRGTGKHESGGSGRKVGVYTFRGTCDSGRRLLKSLYEYCQSYDQQRWSRWVHTLKASDFSDKLFER
jgi:hypothetical protein